MAADRGADERSARCRARIVHDRVARRSAWTSIALWETIYEGNPQQILERREAVTLVPLLIMQGALDDNVLSAVQEKFAATYRAAGGMCELTVFEGRGRKPTAPAR